MLIIYFGRGEGKSCSVLGHIVRALGHGDRALFVQFMKGRKDTGEYMFLRDFENVEVHLCGSPKFLKEDANRKAHLEKVKKGMEIVKEKGDGFDLVVLDEILYAVKFGLIKEKELHDLIDKLKANILITGRAPSKAIIDKSDIVTEMKEVKHHYHEDKKTVKGIDY